jgi:tetratricopeptide (TPR) repeat protein
MKSAFAAVLVCSLLVGCAAPINIRNAEKHAQAGYVAQRNDDWDTARRQFAQAVVNADLGGAEAQGKGVVNYEYGRTLGVTCFYEEAEKYLLRSKEFQEQQGQSPHLALYELGLLTEKQRLYVKAAAYFSQLIPLMEKAGLQSQYPLGVADAYERYGNALKELGKDTDARLAAQKASSIRAENPNAKPFGRVTPYGTACAKAS